MMANADRGLDSAHHFRDIIDFIVAVRGFGRVHGDTIKRVRRGYNTTAEEGIEKTVRLLQGQPDLLDKAMEALAVDPEVRTYLRDSVANFELADFIDLTGLWPGPTTHIVLSRPLPFV